MWIAKGLLGFSLFCLSASQCSPNPCENDGICAFNTVKPPQSDKRLRGKKYFDFKCTCKEGFTGTKCEWPCMDIYKSCDALWKKEKRCTVFRQWTAWYDTNCPVTCGVCQFRNATVPKEHPPFAPILEPVMWLIGKWRLDASADNHNFPVEFSKRGPFVHEMEFSVAQVPMFGTPCLNYTSISYRTDDLTDQQVEKGFISVKDRWRVYPVNVALMRTNNNGAILFEEGDADFSTAIMNLNLTYWKASPTVKHRFPIRATRRFSLKNNLMLVETNSQRLNEGPISYSNYYQRVDNLKPVRHFVPVPATAPPPTLPDISGKRAGDEVPEDEIKIASGRLP